MGVCCIVFDIDGMLFEFCMNFLNFQNVMFSSRFMLFPTFKTKIWCKTKISGGVEFFHLLVKWEMVSPNSR